MYIKVKIIMRKRYGPQLQNKTGGEGNKFSYGNVFVRFPPVFSKL